MADQDLERLIQEKEKIIQQMKLLKTGRICGMTMEDLERRFEAVEREMHDLISKSGYLF